jgi:hypothetical protein
VLVRQIGGRQPFKRIPYETPSAQLLIQRLLLQTPVQLLGGPAVAVWRDAEQAPGHTPQMRVSAVRRDTGNPWTTALCRGAERTWR